MQLELVECYAYGRSQNGENWILDVFTKLKAFTPNTA